MWIFSKKIRDSEGFDFWPSKVACFLSKRIAQKRVPWTQPPRCWRWFEWGWVGKSLSWRFPISCYAFVLLPHWGSSENGDTPWHSTTKNGRRPLCWGGFTGRDLAWPHGDGVLMISRWDPSPRGICHRSFFWTDILISQSMIKIYGRSPKHAKGQTWAILMWRLRKNEDNLHKFVSKKTSKTHQPTANFCWFFRAGTPILVRIFRILTEIEELVRCWSKRLAEVVAPCRDTLDVAPEPTFFDASHRTLQWEKQWEKHLHLWRCFLLILAALVIIDFRLGVFQINRPFYNILGISIFFLETPEGFSAHLQTVDLPRWNRVISGRHGRSDFFLEKER